jgi:hypothetical protein
MGITRRNLGSFIIAALAAAFSLGDKAKASSSAYGIFEVESSIQTSSTAIAPFTSLPFLFSIQGSGQGTLTLPNGTSAAVAVNSTFQSSDLLDSAFASQSSLQAAYPSGTYKLNITGEPSLTYTVGTPTYPASAPQVTNGTWQNGVLVVDPTTAATLNFSTFKEYASGGIAGHMSVQINSAGPDSVNLKQEYATINAGSGTTTSATPFTSYTIPAGTLTAGLPYIANLRYDTVSSVDTTSISGALSVLLFDQNSYFFIVAKSATAVAAPVVSGTLANQTGPLGGSATFNPGVTFGTSQEPNNTSWFWAYQGQFLQLNGSKYQLGPGGTLTITNLTAADAGTYQLFVVTGGGMASSTAATLTIGAASSNPPSISVQPYSESVAAGSTAVFHCVADSGTYQWRLNGNALSDGNGISGATSKTLIISGASVSNAGNYACAVTNPAGTTTSNTASLNVSSTNDPGRLVNISCRAGVGTGANILIVGFVSGGTGTSGTQPVLIRGTGPALLASFGVPGTLPDPALSLYQGTNVVASNTGWGSGGNASTITAEDTAVGAFTLTNTASKDSALYIQNLATNSYTAQIAGASGDTGVALAEVYDATPTGTYTSASPRIINISARVQVGTGGNILIAGFVIGGSTSKTVLIRASGPALGVFGVPGTLADPQLTLYSGSTALASNSGWGGGTAISNTAAAVGAFAWSNPSSLDSALLVTLPPGGYTVQVAGAAGTATDTGVALVEVYDVP